MSRNPNKDKPSNEELIALIQQEAAKLGRTPTKRAFQYGDLAYKRFGSWEGFLASAGLKPTSRKKEITNEELIKLVQERAAELGRTPGMIEFQQGFLAKLRFGKWSIFLKSAGLKPAENKRSQKAITNQELIELIKLETEKLGRVPKTQEFQHHFLAKNRFGSWGAFIKNAGLELTLHKKSITNEELIALIRKQAAELGRTPFKKEFEHGILIQTRFGNWGNFLQRAGLEPASLAMRRSSITNEELIQSVQKRADELGHTPLKDEFEYASLVSYRFDSWEEFLKSAGLTKAKRYKIAITNEELVKRVQEKAAELGRPPTVDEFEYAHIARGRIGTWKKFLIEAGLDPGKSSVPMHSISNEELIKLVQEKAAELGRSPIIREFKYSPLAISRFGGWGQFLSSAKLEPRAVGEHKDAITDEELKNSVVKLALKLKRSPARREFEYEGIAIYRYGTWTNFLKTVGLKPLKSGVRTKPSDWITGEQLTDWVRERAEELGRTPIMKEFRYSGIAAKRYGGWKKFLNYAGLEPGRRKPIISDEELIKAFQEKTAELACIPTRNEFQHSTAAVYRYGTWLKFLQHVGLGFDESEQEISKEELIKLVQEQAAELERTPLKKEFKYGELARIMYGSWEAFLQSAELELERIVIHFSDEELIEQVQKLAAELGRTPVFAEFTNNELVIKRFGGWVKFLKLAGLEPTGSKNPITDEELFQKVQEHAAQLGSPPSIHEFEYGGIAAWRFGSWNQFLENAGLDPQRYRLFISDEELIELVQQQAAELGRTPTREEFRHRAPASRRFGNWKQFINSAGLELPPRKLGPISEEMLFSLVQKQAAELGRSPINTEFEHAALAAYRYGSWNRFLESAGLEPRNKTKRKRKRQLSGEELIEAIQEQAAALGQTPKTKEFDYHSQAVAHFGSWNKFLEQAGLEPRKRKSM